MAITRQIQFEDIYRLHKAGLGNCEIAKRLGSTSENIRQRLIRGDRSKRADRIIIESEQLSLVARYNSGESLSKVARSVRISPQRLEKILRDDGVTPEKYHGCAPNAIRSNAQPHRESEFTCVHYARCLTKAAIAGLPLDCGKCKPTRPECVDADVYASTGENAGIATTRMPGLQRDWRPGNARMM